MIGPSGFMQAPNIAATKTGQPCAQDGCDGRIVGLDDGFRFCTDCEWCSDTGRLQPPITPPEGQKT